MRVNSRSSSSPRDGCISAVEHMFNDTAMYARHTGKQSFGEGKQSKSWSKGEGKVKSKENKVKIQRNHRCQRLAHGQNIENWSLRSSKLEIRGKIGHSGICTDMSH